MTAIELFYPDIFKRFAERRSQHTIVLRRTPHDGFPVRFTGRHAYAQACKELAAELRTRGSVYITYLPKIKPVVDMRLAIRSTTMFGSEQLHYIRNVKVPRGICVVFVPYKSDTVWIGAACCNPADQFNRHIGFAMAISRAIPEKYSAMCQWHKLPAAAECAISNTWVTWFWGLPKPVRDAAVVALNRVSAYLDVRRAPVQHTIERVGAPVEPAISGEGAREN